MLRTMTGNRIDLDQTVIRIGGKDRTAAQLVRAALGLTLALVCALAAMWFGENLLYVGALIGAAYAVGTLIA